MPGLFIVSQFYITYGYPSPRICTISHHYPHAGKGCGETVMQYE